MTAAKRKLSATATSGLRFLDGVLQQLWTISDGDRQWDHWSDVPHDESLPEPKPIDWKNATPAEQEQHVFEVFRRNSNNPTLTIEQFRERAKRHQEKERIRKQEEAAKRKAKREAKNAR